MVSAPPELRRATGEQPDGGLLLGIVALFVLTIGLPVPFRIWKRIHCHLSRFCPSRGPI